MTKDLWLLDDIQRVCEEAGYPNPIPEYKSQYQMAVDLGEYPPRGLGAIFPVWRVTQGFVNCWYACCTAASFLRKPSMLTSLKLFEC